MVKVKMTGRKAKKTKGKGRAAAQTGATVRSAPKGVPFVAQRVSRAVRAPGKSPAMAAHHRMVCSVSNPFCNHARGAKQMGVGSVPSIPWQFRQLVQINTDADGAATFVVLANPYLGYANSPKPPSLAFAAANGKAQIGDFSPWLGASGLFGGTSKVFSTARIVSLGVIFRVNCAMTNAKGQLILNEVRPANSGVSPATVIQTFTGSFDGSATRVEPIASGNEVCWISRCSPPLCETYQTPADLFYQDGGYSSLVLEIVAGPASQAALTAEIYVNIEACPLPENAVTSRLATPAATPNKIAMVAQQKVQNAVGGFISGGVEAAEARVAQLASSALSEFGSFVGSGLAMLGL